jgi:hypothetical protein
MRRNPKADLESTFTLVGPFAIGVAAAGYGVAADKLTIGGAVAVGWALWQLTMIVVVLWGIATTRN